MREMKDCELSNFSTIPAHWKIQKLKTILTLRSERNSGDRELLSVYLDRGVISYSDSTGMQVHKPSQDLSNYQNVHIGDFVLNNQQAWRGSVGVSKYDGIISPAYFVYHLSQECYPRYMNYLFRDFSMVQQYETSSRGVGTIQRNIFAPWLLNCWTIIPPYDEQVKIANHLDSKCTEIDALIVDIQTQIDTLEQYKRSVITETVTKGLNHNVVMKDSGIVWIGKVPAKWRVENAKYHFTQRQERATKEMVQLTASQKYGVVTQAEYMELTGARVVVVQKDFDILKKVCAGDFVIHMRSFQGGLEYSTKTGSISSAYVMLIPKESIVEPRYYRWFFKSSAYIDALSSTSNLVRDGQAMRWANFIQLPITIPPADEQTQIANFLDAKCAEIDSIIASKKAQLETLDAYKKSLIFEYVTGKKEVPETVTVVSINPHVPLLAMVVDMLKKPRGEVVDQKLLYLCDVYLGLGLSTQYYRWDYGPFDKQLYSYIDTLVSNGWYKVNIQNKAKVLVKAENHAEALEMYGNQLAQNKSDIEKLVQYFGEMRVSEIERFATLFAVWNDFIIDGIPAPSDYQIIDDVLTNWGPTKGRFSRDTWQNTLMKMKRDGIIPKGLGLHTLPKPEGGKSDA